MKKVLSFILALCMICTLLPATALTASAADGKYVKVDLADIQSTDIVLITVTKKDGNTYAMSNDKGTSNGPAPVLVTITDNKITSNVTDNIKWNITNSGGNLTIYPNGTTAKWLYCTSTNNGVRVGTNANKVFTIDASSGYLKNTATSRYLGVYNTQDWRCYTSPTTANIANQTLAFYKYVEASTPETEPDILACEHTNQVPIGEAKDATCTDKGITAGVKCADCGETITAQEEIKATGHTYADGVCSTCGAAEPNEEEVTITFDANKTQRTSYSTSAQVWSNKGVVFTNNKSGSQNDVGNYSNPIRVYANSSIVIDAPGNISKIVVTCSSNDYATALKNSVGAEAEASGKTVTITPSASADTYTIAKITTQTRISSLTVTYAAAQSGETTCKHTNQVAIGEAKDATCTEDGITAGLKCADPECGAVIEQQETIPATGHNYVDGVCSCGDKLVVYQLVTDASSLKIGDKIVIVATESGVAMSTTQNANNRGQIATTKGDGTVNIVANMQVLTLEAGAVAGTFALNTGSGYLCAASSSSNYLRTQETNDDNSSWKIEIDAESGIATVKAQGDKTVNWMRYNSSNKIFSCYDADSSQKDISIYKLPGKQVDYIPAEGEIVSYQSWDDAMAALENVDSGTLRLMADQNVGEINFSEKNIVIDLNGSTLTANTIYATVMDSLDGNGLISTPNKAMLSAVNGQMILWDNNAKGYRVFNYNWSNLDGAVSEGARAEGETVTNRTFWSVLTFDNDKAYQMAGASDLEIGFNVRWTPDDGTTSSKYFKFDQSVIIDWGNEQLKNMAVVQGFYVRLTGFEVAATNGKIDVTPVVKTTFTTVATETTSHDYTAD